MSKISYAGYRFPPVIIQQAVWLYARFTLNQRWSLDFVSDQMTDCRRFRVLTVVDDCTRECLALVADTSLSGMRVARELKALMAKRGNPRIVAGSRQAYP